MVARDDEPPAFELNAAYGAGRVPRPSRIAHVLGDFDGLRPADSVVVALGDPDGAVLLALAVFDLPLCLVTEVLGEGQPDGAGVAVDDGAGVADGVGAEVGDNLQALPGRAVVQAALENHVDVAGITAAILAAFAESEHRAFLAHHHARDAKRVIALPAGDKDIRLSE